MKTELQERCTICYEILNSPEHITITKELLKNLRFLVQTIDFPLHQHKPICETCVAKIKSTCKFKTTYLDLHKNFIKVKNEEGVCLVFCEICKDIVNSSDTIPLFDPLSQVNKSIIINHFCPELESRINEDPQTCESCHKSMLSFCNFTNLLSSFNQNLICDENESESVTVKKELQQSDIASTSVNYSEHCSAKVKDEVVQDVKVEKNSIEYNEFIAKNEELDLKMDCEEESGEEGKWTQTVEETREKTVTERDMHIHNKPDEREMFRCKLCKYKAKKKRYFNSHMHTHKKGNPLEVFQCSLCEYNTIYKSCLTKHMTKHKDPGEVVIFHCDVCEFNTKHKYLYQRHLRRHKKPDEVEMFQCEICEYKTMKEYRIKMHMLRHKRFTEVETFQCKICEYKTKYKCSIKKHMLIHNTPDNVVMFQCVICQYKTNRKSNLTTHMLSHKKPEEVEMFQCEICEYKTRRKCKLIKHIIRHKKPG